MLILGIETSCDDSAAAVVDECGLVHGEAVANQFEQHRPFGGVVPEIASRQHLEALPPVIDACLDKAGVSLDDLDGVAVTIGPGLMGSLLVGVEIASGLAWMENLALYGVHHVAAHLFAPFLKGKETSRVNDIRFPYMGLCASGGHTGLYRVDGPGRIIGLGETRDDAAGEAFDKVSKLLGLGYPGGPAIEKAAENGDPGAVTLPRALRGDGSLEFSFSGLKTAAVQHVKAKGIPSGQALSDLCASFQAAVIEPLVEKSIAAAKRHRIPSIALTGGVAANRSLRDRMSKRAAEEGLELIVPQAMWCTDNGAMVAFEAALGIASGARAVERIEPRATWPLPR